LAVVLRRLRHIGQRRAKNGVGRRLVAVELGRSRRAGTSGGRSASNRRGGTAMRPAAVHDSDNELATRVAGHDEGAFEALMRRHNQRLFRVARAILADDADAEDALQDAYLEAYRHMAEFRREAQLLTWLTRIVVNHALMRLRKQKRHAAVVSLQGRSDRDETGYSRLPDDSIEPPSHAALRAEVRRVMERRIDDLPLAFRTVFIMRDVEDMSVQDTADALGIPSATVRTRLFRARALLREALARDLDIATPNLFGFAGDRCDRIVAGVLARLPAETAAGS
jgi:RNA polymerase sigma-70 factor, ECF subfamily